MFKHQIQAVGKHLAARKLNTLINVLGLAVGLCVFILVYFFVEREFSYDRQWEHAERIYRLNTNERPGSVAPQLLPFTPYLIGPLLEQSFPEQIEVAARGTFLNAAGIVIDEERVPETVRLFERKIIDIFSFEVLAGSLEATLDSPNRVALSEESALLYFGGDSPLGRTLAQVRADGTTIDYEVTAVYRIPEGETMLASYFPNIALLDDGAVAEMADFLSNWEPPHLAFNFFRLAPGIDIEELNRQINALIDPYIQAQNIGDDYELDMQPITKAYFAPNNGESGGELRQVWSFMAIGSLALLLGIVNYVILTTADIVERSREVGIRKVAGASRGELIRQFVAESMLVTTVALIAALALAESALPFFSNLVSRELTIDYLKPANVVFLLGLVVAVGGLGGLYPAMLLARSRPEQVLKQGGTPGRAGSGSVRNMLLGLQFAIAITLMIATLVMYFQLSFYQNRNHGFNADNLLVVRFSGPPNPQRYNLKSVFTEEVKRLPDTIGASLSMREANASSQGIPIARIGTDATSGDDPSARMQFIGYEFFSVYEIPLLAGRSYDQVLDGSAEARQGRIIINRFAARALGFSSPAEAVGQVIRTDMRNSPESVIIGVVEDSQFVSLRESVDAEVYVLNPIQSFLLTVRFRESATGTIVDDVQAVWREVFGDETFNSAYAIDGLRQEFTQEEDEGKLLLTLSFLAIFVACLGLYGLVAFSVNGRVKEVGIRKVLGAGVGTIVGMFLWQFSRPVMLANLVAWPLAAWAMLQWLQRFPFQVDYLFLLPLFVMASGVALMIAWLTVGGTAAKAATAKPVLALRYE